MKTNIVTLLLTYFCFNYAYGQENIQIVDLGISVKWASCNIGADKPEDFGGYYAWGELYERDNYYWSTYSLSYDSTDEMIKYNTKSQYGYIDNKTVLELEDDVAHQKLGDKWRIPTHEEWIELHDKCTWVWNHVNEIPGYTVTGPSGNSIFIPRAGCYSGTEFDKTHGFYWSSSLYPSSPYKAWIWNFDSKTNTSQNHRRYKGMTIRPVYGESIITHIQSYESDNKRETKCYDITGMDANKKSKIVIVRYSNGECKKIIR